MSDRVAFLLDGGFVTAKFAARIGRFPEARDVIEFVRARMTHPRLADASLFRIYWYDAPPLAGRKTHPSSREPFVFEARPTFVRNQRLQDTLATTADVAVRRGEGMRVCLETLGHGVHRGMREHADFVFDNLEVAPCSPPTSRGS